MTINAGQPAPLFTLTDSDKNKVSLADYKGKPVLLLFFPLAFTGTCTTELCSVRDDISFYNNIRVNVLGISVDSLFSLGKFKEEQKLNFPLLSDFNKEASTAYDCLYPEFVHGMKGVSKRSAFVVDAKGIIRYAEVLEVAGNLPDFNAIKNTLQQLEKEAVA